MTNKLGDRLHTGDWQLKISITFPTLNWVINGLKNPRLWGENWTRQVNVCVTLDQLVLFEYLQVLGSVREREAGTKIAAVNILMKKSFSTRNFDWKATAFDSAPPVCLVTPKRTTTKTPNGRYWFDTLMWGYRTYREFAINAFSPPKNRQHCSSRLFAIAVRIKLYFKLPLRCIRLPQDRWWLNISSVLERTPGG